MKQDKPGFLGPEYGTRFEDDTVAAAYASRPPYPPRTIDVLEELVRDPNVVLDAGAGTGELARPLALRQAIRRVDALEPSEAMIAQGRVAAGGGAQNLRWIFGTAENGPFDPPYGLIVAAQSLHWFDWYRALPRFRTLLGTHAALAIVDQDEAPRPWSDQLRAIIPRYATNPGFQHYDIVSELEQRSLFRLEGSTSIDPEQYTRTIDDYVESFHGRSALSRTKMARSAAAEFDDRIRSMVQPYAEDGRLLLAAGAKVVWGQPLEG